MNEELKAEIRIPFTNREHARIVFNTLSVDKEPRKELITRKLTLIDNGTVLRADWVAKEARLLRVSINSFLDHLNLVLNTIDQFREI
jgi:EKC/KEOPS complex subunit PCC1/LAGE3